MTKPTQAPENKKSTAFEVDTTKAKPFQCHKQVLAMPMTRGNYNKYRGWEIPKDENPADAGYLVIYDQGTEDHYESWSPKKQFDAGYAAPEAKGKATDITKASELPPEVKIFGNGDLWQLICKASGPDWMKSTKAMELPNLGCLVQVTTQQGDAIAEAVVFAPQVKVAKDREGNPCLKY